MVSALACKNNNSDHQKNAKYQIQADPQLTPNLYIDCNRLIVSALLVFIL